jgi:hypothetical protein
MAARLDAERVTGIEPALSAWEADVLPLNYTRKRQRCYSTVLPTCPCQVIEPAAQNRRAGGIDLR